MRHFNLLLFLIISLNLYSQNSCYHDFNILKSFWEGKSITLKWNLNPLPKKGTINIYRKQKEAKVWDFVGRITKLKTNDNFSDSDSIKLKKFKSYEYRLVLLAGNSRCTTNIKILATAIEDGDFTNVNDGKNINGFRKQEVYEIIPEKLTAKPMSNLKVTLKIKDVNFPFKTNMEYYIIQNDLIYKTSSFTENDDYRTPLIYVHPKSPSATGLKIAIMQDNIIIGVSPLISFE